MITVRPQPRIDAAPLDQPTSRPRIPRAARLSEDAVQFARGAYSDQSSDLAKLG
jgi:hypothetical protein